MPLRLAALPWCHELAPHGGGGSSSSLGGRGEGDKRVWSMRSLRAPLTVVGLSALR